MEPTALKKWAGTNALYIIRNKLYGGNCCPVQKLTLVVFVLDYLYDVCLVFGPSVQVFMKTTRVCPTFHYLMMGHTYSVVKMHVFTQLYFYFKYFAF